jgi:hypothetical protein
MPPLHHDSREEEGNRASEVWSLGGQPVARPFVLRMRVAGGTRTHPAGLTTPSAAADTTATTGTCVTWRALESNRPAAGV